MRKWWLIVVLFSLFIGCNDEDESSIGNVEERESNAVNSLKEELMNAPFGWRADYRPFAGSGSFLMLMTFDENTVRIQSDLLNVDEGAYLDLELSYRVESNLGINLVFETYGPYHYLFDFLGGDFQFQLQEEANGSITFFGKSSGVSVVFTENQQDESGKISETALGTLDAGRFNAIDLSSASIGDYGMFNVYLPETNHTISVGVDLFSRTLALFGGGVGRGQDEIVASDQISSSGLASAFSLESDRIVLDQSLSIAVDGTTYSISEISLEEGATQSVLLCGSELDQVSAAGRIDAIAFESMQSDPFQVSNGFSGAEFLSSGLGALFTPSDELMVETILESFPDAAGFQLYRGLDLGDGEFLNAVGFVTVDGSNNVKFFLREFSLEEAGNLITFNFTGDYFISPGDATEEELQSLDLLTDLLFAPEVYMMQIPSLFYTGLFEYYNPCTQYKGFLFEN